MSDGDNEDDDGEERQCFWCMRRSDDDGGGGGELCRCRDCLCAYSCPEHWVYHKDEGGRGRCRPFRISRSLECGRHLVAARDLSATELIMRDAPTVVGPSRQQEHVVCVECFGGVDGDNRCDGCNFPLCGRQCCGIPSSCHRLLECELLKERGFRAADKSSDPRLRLQISAVTPLRLLLERPRARVDFCERPLKPITKFETSVIDVIRSDFGLSELFSPSDVLSALSQILLNAKSLEAAGNEAGSGMYPVYSMANHSCAASAMAIVGGSAKGYELQLRAQVPIRKGEEIAVRYLCPNIGLPTRQSLMSDHWSFKCRCDRCMDPAENGSFNSCLVCPNGDCTPPALQYLTPRDGGAFWRCDGCGGESSLAEVKSAVARGNERVRRAMRGLDRLMLAATTNGGANRSSSAEEMLERAIEELERSFHPSHYLIIQVKYVLLSVLSNVDGGGGDKFDQHRLRRLQRSVTLCQELLRLLDCIDSGRSRNRGWVLKQLIPAWTRLSLALLKADLISSEEFRHRKETGVEYAKELVQCFSSFGEKTSRGDT